VALGKGKKKERKRGRGGGVSPSNLAKTPFTSLGRKKKGKKEGQPDLVGATCRPTAKQVPFLAGGKGGKGGGGKKRKKGGRRKNRNITRSILLCVLSKKEKKKKRRGEGRRKWEKGH